MKEKICWDFVYSLKMKLVGFVDGLRKRYERKR